MITNSRQLEKFERELQQGETLSLDQKFLILDGMYALAQSFGHFNNGNDDHLHEHQIATAKIIRLSCLNLHLKK